MGQAFKKDDAKAFGLMQKSALEGGVAEAHASLGMMYERGIGTDKDYNKASQHYRLGIQLAIKAHCRCTQAEWLLSQLIFKGQAAGTPHEAMQLLRESTFSMAPETWGQLGSVYEHGFKGLTKDVREAVRCYRADASCRLAVYTDIDVVAHNQPKAKITTMNREALQPRRVGVPGALASPHHALWARDQLAALLACVAVPRCGARSPASLVPHHVLACDIGQRFALHVSSTAVVCGYNLVSAAYDAAPQSGGAGAGAGAVDTRREEAVPSDPTGVVCVGVSMTLGVVGCRGWGGVQRPLSVLAWMGVCRCDLYVGNSHVADVVDLAEMTAVEEVVDGIGVGDGPGLLQVCRGAKWAVIYHLFGEGAGRIAVRPLGLRDGANRAVDVGRGVVCVEWVDMINANEAALSTRTGGQYDAKFHILCVDLEKSYQSGQLVVTDSFQGFRSLTHMVFQSKGHGLIVVLNERNKSNDGSWVVELRSLRPLKVLHTCSDFLFHKVDNTHFAEEDSSRHTLSVFSTDDFETPVRIFTLNGKFKCGNGFIAFTQREERCFDLVDAVTGSWLLRLPFLPNSYTDSNWLDLSSS
ncbi:hypothetical protein Pelo_15653 [Pelomyxa schiedti]|nr:hypothetical protein Pelo_15653 [Pelomyxa schiedti]